MKVLVACEFSGVVRDAFRAKGHDAWSCDLLPCDAEPTYHIQGDVREILNRAWDLMIAHPPCTYLACSGARWFKDRLQEQLAALDFVGFLLRQDIPRIALENPVGVISSVIRRPDQIIQPWYFGEDASKKTCLWLKNLPPLVPTHIIDKRRYANQTPSGQNKLGPSQDRAKLRSVTYKGIAEAMADQWGKE
jgi:hypothetical protein